MTLSRVHDLAAELPCGCPTDKVARAPAWHGITVEDTPTLPAYPGDLPYFGLVANLHAAGHSDLFTFLAAGRHQPMRVLDGL